MPVDTQKLSNDIQNHQVSTNLDIWAKSHQGFQQWRRLAYIWANMDKFEVTWSLWESVSNTWMIMKGSLQHELSRKETNFYFLMGRSNRPFWRFRIQVKIKIKKKTQMESQKQWIHMQGTIVIDPINTNYLICTIYILKCFICYKKK